MKDSSVTIYSASWCGFCHSAKNYFDDIKVKYIDRDVESDPKAGEESIKKSGQRGIPVIDIAGDIIVGFDRPKIDASLKAHHLV